MASGKRELGPWPLVIGAVIIILAAVWFFSRAVPPPVVPADSPAAEGTAGVPSGADGVGEKPGSPDELEAEHASSRDPNSPEPAGEPDAGVAGAPGATATQPDGADAAQPADSGAAQPADGD